VVSYFLHQLLLEKSVNRPGWPAEEKLMHIDVQSENCSGCRLCQQICAITHFREINPKKSAIAIAARFPFPGRFEPSLCDQCGECQAACPADAIEEKDGVYIIDPELCSGCEACIEACPSNAIRLPKGCDTPIKCDLCMKCVEVCNTGALAAVGIPAQTTVELPCSVSAARRCA